MTHPTTDATMPTTRAKPAPAPATAALSAEPIGTPPHGGRWTWDIPAQVWVELPDTAAAPAAPATETAASQE